ncbi:pentatricopeptide repeat-containing protein At1g31920 [Asparagus officinalis]|uniref:pentatricopeptide repeat-containing protein At1g31920 n=1 Tax=Asparagus officinalis TaxID=4686 RepID=UPI00098E09AC|nr:pentatricopeptide repeat-containing protein At1g31920 [Asparagus officinalis]
MMIGGLAQIQPFTVPPSNNPTQVSEHKPIDQSPCPPSLNQVKSMEEFKQAHARFIKLGFDQSPRHAGELLSVCALADWGSLDYAWSIFSGLDSPGIFDFNTMIRANVNHSDPNAALQLYYDMVQSDVKPDNFTFPFTVKACAQLSALREGMQVHGHVLKFGFDDDVFVSNSLINMYGKCEEVDAACKVFEQIGVNKTVASWSSILAAYNKMGLWSGCLNLFATMINSSSMPDESSLVSVLASCAHLGALDIGRSIHCSLMRNFSGLNHIVQTSLIDMYVKCGLLEKGLLIFNQMQEKNKWAYSAIISGLAIHGDGDRALTIFANMLRDGVEPDEAVYVGVLSACSNAGLIEEGLQYFKKMQLEHQIVPKSQHYGCIVDLLGRAGKINKAHSLIGSMPVELQTDIAWRSLLNACKIHENIEMAECAVRNLVKANCAKAGDYVILSNMYAKVGKWDDAARTRTKMFDRGLTQVPGFSRVEVKGKMHTFVSMDKSHPQSNEVHEMLYQMEWQLKFEGYQPDTSEVFLFNAGGEEKIQALNGHSQKLAIAFGLLNTSEGDSIRLITNLRMSGECHSYTRLISKIFEREIVVRDRNRFHHFRQGACSCRDYW